MFPAFPMLGLGDPGDPIQAAIDGLLLKSPTPSSTDVSNFLKPFPAGSERNAAAQALLARGVAPATVSSALSWLDTSESWKPDTVWNVLSALSMAASFYHGYRRNNSIGWAAAWGVMAVLFPIVTPTLAVAQGFGKKKAS